MKKRVIALLLTLCLAALLPTTALAAEGAKTYLALGDSITTGYAPGGTTVASPFADQLAAEYGYTLVNRAQDGETTASLLAKLEAEEIDVSGADLVTISIGGNDLLQALYQTVAAVYAASGATGSVEETLAQLMTGTADAAAWQAMAVFLQNFAGSETVTDAVAAAGVNLAAILTAVKTANPTARIILLNQYNPYSHVEGAALKVLVSAVDTGVQALNTGLAAVAKAAGVAVADVYTPMKDAAENPCNANLAGASGFSIDIHPNQTGHNLIAATLNQLLAESAADAEDAVQAFADVRADDWYYEAVTYCADQGLMSGVGSKSFDPDGSVTRAMVWTVLARLAGEQISGAGWAEAAKTWAKAAGVSDGSDPMRPVTRQELAAMLYRFAGSPAVSGDLSAYADAADVAAWAGDALVWATDTGLINGIGGRLSPAAGAPRSQLATMLMRQLQQSAA